MGGESFITKKKGETADDAFRDAVKDAQYERGHGGYTGTIAEKREFELLEIPEGMSVNEFVSQKMNDNDKWGPAFCVRDEKADVWVFFGFASS